MLKSERGNNADERNGGNEVAAMKLIREILPRGNEAMLAAALLLLYAAALFLSPDPEWTLWAGQMAMGVLYVPDPPTMQGMAQGDAVRVVSAAGALGTLVLAALLWSAGIVKGRTEPLSTRKYRGDGWSERR